MAKQFVFLVHGMGRYAVDAWADHWKAHIIEILQQYGDFKSLSAEQIQNNWIEFIPVTYDSVFQEEYRDRWANLAGAINDPNLPGDLRRVVQFVEDSRTADEKSVFWDYLLDPILWHISDQARERVIARVATQIAGGLQRMQEANRATDTGVSRAHVIAHSLGTSVVHDAIVSMSDANATGSVFRPPHFRWKTVVMASNVSRLLKALKTPSDRIPLSGYHPYGSKVQPGVSGSLVERFYNLRHRADPFTWVREFRPDWDQAGYRYVPVDRFDHLTGVHDFQTYFDDPAVHFPVLSSITGKRRVGKIAEKNAVRDRYKSTHGSTTQNPFPALWDLIGPSAERELGVAELANYLIQAYRALLP